jgi:hypothetical protein
VGSDGRLREAVGASELVRLSTTEWLRQVAGPAGAEIVQESSGNSILLVDYFRWGRPAGAANHQ